MGHSTSNQPKFRNIPGTPSQNLIKFGQCVHQHILGSCAKIFPHNVVWYLRYDHFYTGGGVLRLQVRPLARGSLVMNCKENQLYHSLGFFPSSSDFWG